MQVAYESPTVPYQIYTDNGDIARDDNVRRVRFFSGVLDVNETEGNPARVKTFFLRIDGLINEQVAGLIGRSTYTVHNYMPELYAEIDAANGLHAMSRMFETRVVTLDRCLGRETISLANKELGVLGCASAGKTVIETASLLDIAELTVKSHRTRMTEKDVMYPGAMKAATLSMRQLVLAGHLNGMLLGPAEALRPLMEQPADQTAFQPAIVA